MVIFLIMNYLFVLNTSLERKSFYSRFSVFIIICQEIFIKLYKLEFSIVVVIEKMEHLVD